MKKLLLPFFAFVASTGFSQSPIEMISKKYFRAHPFDMRFSSFITSLQQDPWFTLETLHRRTDTSFFYLSGSYKNINPFKFLPKEIKLIVGEQEITHTDSLQTLDTIINLQIIAMADSSIAAAKDAAKEFKRFHSAYSSRFSNNLYDGNKSKGIINAEMYNYFIAPFTIAPVTIAWGKYPTTSQYCFTITIRFKVRQNIADLIIAPNDSF